MGAWVVWLLLAALLPRVGISVQPRIAKFKEALRIECRIARHPDNRYLILGLVDITESHREIHGEHDRVIHELIVRSVPCETVLAYCLLVDQHGKSYVARQSVLVFPCRVPESL